MNTHEHRKETYRGAAPTDREPQAKGIPRTGETVFLRDEPPFIRYSLSRGQP